MHSRIYIPWEDTALTYINFLQTYLSLNQNPYYYSYPKQNLINLKLSCNSQTTLLTQAMKLNWSSQGQMYKYSNNTCAHTQTKKEW